MRRRKEPTFLVPTGPGGVSARGCRPLKKVCCHSIEVRRQRIARRGHQDGRGEHNLKLRLDGFAWQAIAEESSSLEVSVEDFIAFAVLYYLADVDSGRVARQIVRSPYQGAS
jgi:hypothetical protein